MEADFCKSKRIFQDFSSSTIFAHFCAVLTSVSQQQGAKCFKMFSRFFNIEGLQLRCQGASEDLIRRQQQQHLSAQVRALQGAYAARSTEAHCRWNDHRALNLTGRGGGF